jgi:hypothetical protein
MILRYQTIRFTEKFYQLSTGNKFKIELFHKTLLLENYKINISIHVILMKVKYWYNKLQVVVVRYISRNVLVVRLDRISKRNFLQNYGN